MYRLLVCGLIVFGVACGLASDSLPAPTATPLAGTAFELSTATVVAVSRPVGTVAPDSIVSIPPVAGARRLVREQTGAVAFLASSPDGKRFAYSVIARGAPRPERPSRLYPSLVDRLEPNPGLGDRWLRIVESDGTIEREQRDDTVYQQVTWSPSGRYLAYREEETSAPNRLKPVIGVLNVETLERTRIPILADQIQEPNFAWSPVADRLAILSRPNTRNAAGVLQITNRVDVIDVATGANHVILEEPTLLRAVFSDLVWSSDGSALVFTRGSDFDACGVAWLKIGEAIRHVDQWACQPLPFPGSSASLVQVRVPIPSNPQFGGFGLAKLDHLTGRLERLWTSMDLATNPGLASGIVVPIRWVSNEQALIALRSPGLPAAASIGGPIFLVHTSTGDVQRYRTETWRTEWLDPPSLLARLAQRQDVGGGGQPATTTIWLLPQVPGPVRRVAGTESCLNVRIQPGTGATVIDCAPDGISLVWHGERREVGGLGWLRVSTPKGLDGWASAEFLVE